MKKILLLVLALLMMLPIVACDKTPADSDPEIDPKEVFDFIIEKDPDKDFTVLNLADPQHLWTEVFWNLPLYQIFPYTLEKLIEQTQPDFITIAGDLTKEGEEIVFRKLVEVMDAYKIPWTVVLGNHDHHYAKGDTSALDLKSIAKIFEESQYCLFKAGPEELGCGNFTIGISENGKIVESFIMMDTHSSFMGFEGISEAQNEWYKERIAEIKKTGCDESVALMHITPTHTYNYDTATDLPEIFLDTAVELGHTKTILVGHGHWGWKKDHQGILMVETVQTGSGQTGKEEYDNDINGGTYFKINSDGRCTDVDTIIISIKNVMDRDDCLE